MAASRKQTSENPEINAVSAVYNALKDLDASVQTRVLRYSAEMLGLAMDMSGTTQRELNDRYEKRGAETVQSFPAPPASNPESDDEIEGVSSVARKWMKRSGIEPKELQKLFSLGIDEIDLVAKMVPGSSKRQRMHSVLLLKGIAAYLGTGVPRVAHEQLKEACLHYNAYDMANFAKTLKEFSSEISGTKEAGYTLSARGLSSATELVKEVLAANS